MTAGLGQDSGVKWDKVDIALRFGGFAMPHAAIAEALGIEPLAAHVLGTPRLGHQGRALGGVHRENFISFELASAPVQGLAAALAVLLDRLEAQQGLFSALQAEAGARCDLFVGYFFRGRPVEVLSPELMRRMAALGIELGLCMNGSSHPDAAPFLQQAP